MAEINTEINYGAIFAAYENQIPVAATVTAKEPKGFSVDVFGLKSFLPGSAVKNRSLVQEGDVLDVLIEKIMAEKGNIVVSNRAIEDARDEAAAKETLETISVGDVVEGVVKTITSYGAFFTVNGLDGLIHMNELSWKKISSPDDVVSVGDRIKVKVVSIEEKKGKTQVAFSLKAMTPNPWDVVNAEEYLGKVLDVKVVQVMDYGAFVSVGDLEGLIHISEMTWSKTKSAKASDYVKRGDVVTAKVITVDVENHKMALSMKALMSDPWSNIPDDLIGREFDGKIKLIENFGLIVEILPGIEGLLHIKNLSWYSMNASEQTAEGDRIRVIVKNVDIPAHKIMLSNKELWDDPLKVNDVHAMIGRPVEARVARMSNQKTKILFNLLPGLYGRVPASQFPERYAGNPEEHFSVGDKIMVIPTGINEHDGTLYLKFAK